MTHNRREDDVRYSVDVKQVVMGFNQALVALMVLSPLALGLLMFSEWARAHNEIIVIVSLLIAGLIPFFFQR